VTNDDNGSQVTDAIVQLLFELAGAARDTGAERSSDHRIVENADINGGVSMLDAVRTLLAMDPEERSTLVALIKAL